LEPAIFRPIVSQPNFSMNVTTQVKNVQDFWGTEACGTHFIKDFENEADFFAKYREYRYETEWHIPLVVPFDDGKDKDVLEIGCGNGVDGVMWAKAGARYTGVDLTEAAVGATKTHFECLGLEGTFQQENAQGLSFDDASFDIVYSHGVLHHTPEPERAFDEVFRVLKPGGRAVLMLYHKSSFNYHFRIMTYMRIRTLLKIASRVGRWGGDRKRLKDEIQGVRGNEDSAVYQIHYDNWLRDGWSYLKPKNFVHHCTDGPECPYAFVYSGKDVQRIFGKNFADVSTRVTHFPLNRYPILRSLPHAFEKALARTMGWYLFIYATKPETRS